MNHLRISLSIFSMLVIFHSAPLFANNTQYLIQEMESLRDSLKIEDPARVDLTLRLADLYFDASIQEGKGEELEVLKKSRLKALDLYKHSLNGTDSLKPAAGLNRIKIQFQMARLLSRLDEMKLAQPYYQDILTNPESPKKMLEQAALALAEWNEEETRYIESKKFYDLAISNCTDRNSCNYAHYRLAWLHYKDTKLDDAIIAMEKSLWSDEAVIRENSLTDLILFLSNKDSDGMKELETIKKISIKAKRPELIRLLVEAFYVAGNRLAGSNLLAELNTVDPNLYYEVRLLEEYYGFRKWDKVSFYLNILEKRRAIDLPKKAEEAKEVLTILRRFVVQVDAEMQVVKELDIFLKRSVEVYLNLYPKDELRTKMQAGWLAVVTDVNKKLTQLEIWIKEDTANNVDPLELRKLRQTRLAIAQNQKLSDIVIEDSLAIAGFLKGTKDADEFLYVAAREHYEQRKFDNALPLFQTIVENAKSTNQISNWAVLSQNLVLDIYNSQKNYDAIISQVSFWKSFSGQSNNEEVQKESKSMDQIMLQAQFEKAFTLKESNIALETFYNICMSGQFVEKSCPNAKVLSVKLKDQEKLVNILEKMGDDESLAIELELMGRFTEAARARERMEQKVAKSSLVSFIKIAFLYELDQQNAERDRILNKMIETFKSEKSLPVDYEKAAFVSLSEANLLSENALLMPWSTMLKIKLASQLEVEKPSELARKVLLGEKEGSGAIWSKVILAQLEEEFNKTNKIKFYGSRSQILFKQRTIAIDKFANLAKPMLTNAELETRIYILQMLKMTYKNIANEILNTPIPDGLDEKTLASVTTKISTMADPFDRANEDYDRLLQQQVAAIADAGIKDKVIKNIQGSAGNFADFIELGPIDKAPQKTIVQIDHKLPNELRKKLSMDPEDKTTLILLKEFYTKNENARFANYYSDRVENLKQVE